MDGVMHNEQALYCTPYFFFFSLTKRDIDYYWQRINNDDDDIAWARGHVFELFLFLLSIFHSHQHQVPSHYSR